MPANVGHKIEAEAKDGGARKDNPRAAGNADAMEGDKVGDGKGDKPASTPGENATVHSKLQHELDQEIQKKPESEWGVTHAHEEQAAETENKVDNANQGASNGKPTLSVQILRV